MKFIWSYCGFQGKGLEKRYMTTRDYQAPAQAEVIHFPRSSRGVLR